MSQASSGESAGTGGTTTHPLNYWGPMTDGYQCSKCGVWVLPNSSHYCGQFNNWPMPYTIYQTVDLTPLITAIDELRESIKELKYIVANKQ